jgi:hypothetical protein
MEFSSFELGYAFLWIFAGICSFLVRRSVREVVSVGNSVMRYRPLTWLPEFRLLSASSDEAIGPEEVIGKDMVFVFADSVRSHEPVPRQKLLSSVHMFSHRYQRVYVVMIGTAANNAEDLKRFESFSGVAVLIDRDGSVARKFNADRTPVAVVFDANGRYVKTGRSRSA